MSTLDEEERREYYRIEDRVALEIIPASQDHPAGSEPLPALFSLLGELHQLDFEAQHLLRQIAERTARWPITSRYRTSESSCWGRHWRRTC